MEEQEPVWYATGAKATEILPDQTKMVQIGQCSILLVNDAGVLCALQGFCAHQNLPLVGGKVWKGVLDCPWHHFQYDIQTGKNLYPRCVYPVDVLPHLRQQINALRTYPVRVVDGFVQVEVSGKCKPEYSNPTSVVKIDSAGAPAIKS